jgi:GR25 family glycosyltransferase involved in LPS biosynthesis
MNIKLILFICILISLVGYKLYFHNMRKNSIGNYNLLNEYFDQINVITLPKRRKYITNVMNSFKIKCNYFPAILKNNINRTQLIQSGFISSKSKLNNGQIACHQSHITVLKIFLQSSDKNCLIFEDDLKYPNFNIKYNDRIKNIMESLPDDYDIIYFGRCWDKCSKNISLNSYLVKCYIPQCRHSYGVTRKGAEKIINYTRNLLKPGDYTISRLIKKGVIIAYGSKPSIFIQNRERLGSNLGNRYIQKECV